MSTGSQSESWTKRLSNLLFNTISGKLLWNNFVLIFLVMLIILLAVWMANTLYLTTSIARMERTHSIQLTESKASLHKYLLTKNESDKALCFKHLEKAYSYSKNFGNMLHIIHNPGAKELLLKVFDEADSKIADIMISRLILLSWLPQISVLITIAADTAVQTEKYRTQIQQIADTQDLNLRSALISKLAIIEDEIENNENNFSKSVGKLSIFVVNLVTIVLIVIFLLFLAITLLMTGSITQSLSKPIKRLVTSAQAIAEGDLSHDSTSVESIGEMKTLALSFQTMSEMLRYKLKIIKQIAEGAGDFTIKVQLASDNDEFGKVLSHMLSSLNSILGQVNQTIEQVLAGSSQVSQASQSLSQNATSQASTLEEISSTIIEITSQSKQNTESAGTVNTIAQSALGSALKGNQQMNGLIEAMNSINVSAEGIKKIVKKPLTT